MQTSASMYHFLVGRCIDNSQIKFKDILGDKDHAVDISGHFLDLPVLLTDPHWSTFLTEEHSEEAGGVLKPTTVTEDDETEKQRDNSEGKNSNQDPGKLLNCPLLILLYSSTPQSQPPFPASPKEAH